MTSQRFPRGIDVYDLAPYECDQIDAVLRTLVAERRSVEDLRFLEEAPDIARAFPPDLVRFFGRFRVQEHVAGIAVTGFQVDDDRIGGTPGHWSEVHGTRRTAREDLYLVLLASLLGDVFGWSTLQNGALVQSVLPMKGEEDAQSGHGSLSLLGWHTEDGFHPYRCDYLALMGMRNLDKVPTTFASIDEVEFSAEEREVLAQPRFHIRPDKEHLRHATEADQGDSSAPTIQALERHPPPVSVLTPHLDRPYIRIDPVFMSAVPGDEEASRVLTAAVARVDEVIDDLVLCAGDVAFIDNYRAVHGRRPFRPRYDGRDRWLRKLVVTRDLRKSAVLRGEVESRVIS